MVDFLIFNKFYLIQYYFGSQIFIIIKFVLLKRVKVHRRGDSPRPLEQEMLDEIVNKEMGNMLQRGTCCR